MIIQSFHQAQFTGSEICQSRFFYRLDLGNKNVSRKFQFAGMTGGSLWALDDPVFRSEVFHKEMPFPEPDRDPYNGVS